MGGERQLRAAIIAFSVKGTFLAEKIKLNLDIYCENRQQDKEMYQNNEVCNIEAVTANRRAGDILPILQMPLNEWVKDRFASCSLLIFVGACGIAVRKIAPFVNDKKTDPAVLVVDDTGKNVISLLSGHLGGANKWTELIAGQIGANAVITTSSDCNEKTAIDLFAKKNKLVITDYKMAKDLEAALLDGETIGLYTELSIVGNIPPEFQLIEMQQDKHDEIFSRECGKKLNYGIVIGLYKNDLFKYTLHLVPQNIVVGVGCRRGKTKEDIINAVDECLFLKGISTEAVEKIASIDLKKDEAGLIEAAKHYKAKPDFFSAEQLAEIKNVSYTSQFVKEVTGVDNVCERAAKLASGHGDILLGKQKKDGVTIAIAVSERRISFE